MRRFARSLGFGLEHGFLDRQALGGLVGIGFLALIGNGLALGVLWHNAILN